MIVQPDETENDKSNRRVMQSLRQIQGRRCQFCGGPLTTPEVPEWVLKDGDVDWCVECLVRVLVKATVALWFPEATPALRVRASIRHYTPTNLKHIRARFAERRRA